MKGSVMRLRATTHIRNDKMLEARARLGLSQTKAAHLCGVNPALYMRLERLDFPPQYLEDVVCKIASAFSINSDDVMPKELVDVTIQNKTVRVRNITPKLMLDYAGSQRRHYLESPDTILRESEVSKQLLQFVGKLNKQEQKVINCRYGFKGCISSYHEMAKKLILTTVRIRMIEATALKRLKHYYEVSQRHEGLNAS
jgi:DNA-binding XRE family transcriptional regulator